MLTPFTAPPEDYYQNNCCALFDFVLAHYAKLLQPIERSALNGFLAAGDDAQRLLARLLSRKGPVFRMSSCHYDEVASLPTACAELASLGLIELNPAAPADQLLALLKKDELQRLDTRVNKRLSKTKQVLFFLDGVSEQQIREKVFGYENFVGLLQLNLWAKALYLYFGSSAKDWSTFVRRDLGQVAYEQVELTAQAASSRELDAELELRGLSNMVNRLQEVPALAVDLVARLGPQIENRWQQGRRNSILLSMGQHFERLKNHNQALVRYELVNLHPARERQVRIHTKECRTAAADALLERIRSSPWSEEEFQFAARFGKRNAGFQPLTKTYSIADYPETELDHSIEMTAAQILIQANQAERAVHVENRLVRTLTGLIYWPIIFAPSLGAFTNPFQSAPHDFYHPDFVASRQAALDQHELALSDDEVLLNHLHAVIQTKRGIANDLVSWTMLETLPIEEILAHMPLHDIRKLTAFLLRNLRERRAGMPDLFVGHADGSYSLVEVKGPGDQLQPGQRVWLRHLQEMDIPSYVMRLR